MNSQLPKPFLARLQSLLGEEFSAFLASYEDTRPTGVRVNPLKIEPQAFPSFAPFPVEPVPWCEEGFFTDSEERPGKHPLHQGGVYYLQEPSAMAVVTLLNPQPGEAILDLCAAPGGKSTHIAGRLQGQGLLWSNEIHPTRVKALGENLERFGAANAIVTNETPEGLARQLSGFFDGVLVDAPCSGEGMFRKDPEACSHWTPEGALGCAQRQIDILQTAAPLVRPGGRLVYSTCTFNPEENEGVIKEFLASHRDFQLIQPNARPGWSPGRPDWVNGPPELAWAFRLWPHILQGEGHFMALLKRQETAGQESGKGYSNRSKGDSLPPSRRETKPLPTAPEFTAFLAETLRGTLEEGLAVSDQGTLHRQGDLLFRLVPGLPPLTGLKILRRGLLLGELKKGRFEPAHSLALALRPSQVHRQGELSLTEAEAYLRGETLNRKGPKGWTLVTFQGFALGWGKQVDEQLKNHYPKGLRRH